ncbi:GNAT family N-acetyltransferase [Dactylosporangium matsuzakiense]|uniref:N-acetyltransferase n=1 Tax=Dactylosporangium matsuzakiense TaxID=53360 RepID=A0A9W6KJA5_9ACTN|nr:GNAT family N-acetyltransferase [Dactylosporangium matsuzakiense]UWZ46305.1 GNAT family N-acetyltransferase [Dactylosporangium matsuzakiense]GLL02002.1 N-acetyltransferase [Dactylosporangium matsuzakiense]
MTEIDIRPTRYGSRVASALTAAALADLGERYGSDGDSTPIEPGEFDPPAGAFFVAYVDGSPAACGGFRTFAEDETTAELKRMYVAPQYRGLGLAKALLRAIEDAARAAGRKRVWLETGTAQPEAIGLYERCGYVRIEDFGHYKGYESVRSYGRDL